MRCPRSSAQHRPSVAPALPLPLVPVEHEIAALNPGRPGGQVLGAAEPKRLPIRPHEDQPRRGVARSAAAIRQVLAVVGKLVLHRLIPRFTNWRRCVPAVQSAKQYPPPASQRRSTAVSMDSPPLLRDSRMSRAGYHNSALAAAFRVYPTPCRGLG